MACPQGFVFAQVALKVTKLTPERILPGLEQQGMDSLWFRSLTFKLA